MRSRRIGLGLALTIGLLTVPARAEGECGLSPSALNGFMLVLAATGACPDMRQMTTLELVEMLQTDPDTAKQAATPACFTSIEQNRPSGVARVKSFTPEQVTAMCTNLRAALTDVASMNTYLRSKGIFR
jgi:hypothetical protein